MFPAILIKIVMVIPFVILAHVRLSKKQRVILYSLFSLVILTMGVIIARLAIYMNARTKNNLTVALLVFLDDIEANTGRSPNFLRCDSPTFLAVMTDNTLAIFVACIGAVRTLFTQQDRSRAPIHHTPYPVPPRRLHHPHSESTDPINSIEVQEIPHTSTKPTVRMQGTMPAPEPSIGWSHHILGNERRHALHEWLVIWTTSSRDVSLALVL